MNSTIVPFGGTAANDAARRSAVAPINAHDQHAQRVREWLLLVLRFAITRERKDEAAADGAANAIDSLGLTPGLAGPSFFRRTTSEICAAITAPDDPQRNVILGKHLARIEDPRLRRAVQAAFDLDERPPSPHADKRQRLWAGLQR
jgi:hypothetical protein